MIKCATLLIIRVKLLGDIAKHIFAIIAELEWRGDSVVKKPCS